MLLHQKNSLNTSAWHFTNDAGWGGVGGVPAHLASVTPLKDKKVISNVANLETTPEDPPSAFTMFSEGNDVLVNCTEAEGRIHQPAPMTTDSMKQAWGRGQNRAGDRSGARENASTYACTDTHSVSIKQINKQTKRKQGSLLG